MKKYQFCIYFSLKKIHHLFNILFLFSGICSIANASMVYQPIEVSGNVTEQGTNDPLVGVNVIIEGTTRGTLTDYDGNYVIEVPGNESVLVFSYVGYETKKVQVNGQREINVQLSHEDHLLDELMVVGYGTQKKRLVTGATAQVSGDDIEKVNTSSTLRALQSQSPGLSIISTSGRPDADFKINIRGLGTLGNAKPLVVIDGIAGGDLRNISPSDISSVDILKDAASAAIYGARAANGVILITTKQGRAGKPVISYDVSHGIQNPERYMDMTGAQDYMMLINEAEANSGLTETDFEANIPAATWERIQDGWEGTDWLRELTNSDAPVTNHSINISGGNNKSTYSIGTSYLYQEGIMGYPLKEEFNRYSFRVNSKHVLVEKNDRDILRVGENILYTFKKNMYQTNGAWRWLSTTPLLPLRDSTGNYTRDDYVTFYSPLNPVAYQYYNSNNERKLHDLRTNVYLELEPVNNLTLRSNFGYSIDAGATRDFIPVYDFGTGQYAKNIRDKTSQSLYLGTSYRFENTLTYQFSIKEKHSINALVGQSIERTGLGESITGENTGSLYNSFQFAYLVNSPNISSSATELMGRPLREWALASFFGRINYDYDETYLFTAIVRRDGSSNFAPGYRWGIFPSISAGWVISNENFFLPFKNVVELLKLRASWGQNGNEDILPFQFVSPYNFSGQDYYFGTSKTVPTVGAYPAILGNVMVTWETSEQLNAGMDLMLFNGSLQLAFDIYKKDTKDWLVDAPNLAIHGAESAFINGGSIENKGFEISANWRKRIDKFSFSLAGSFGYNKNKITRIDNSQGLIEGVPINEYANSQLPPYRAEVGYPISYFWGYETAGVFQTQEQIDAYPGPMVNGENTQPGDLIFVDVNNDGVIDTEDRKMIGDPNPKAIFGFTANFEYAGFDLSVTAAGVAGNDILTAYHSGSVYVDNYPTYLLDRWHGEGTSNRYPRLTSRANKNYTNFSDIYLNKGDYLRVQNLALGYDLSHLMGNKFLERTRVYVAVQNLYTFTNYIGPNPEVGADKGISNDDPRNWAKGIDVYFNPVPRTFSVGANVTF